LASQKAPFDAVGVVIGLGFVLSFGYWCTDFVQMQRAFTARTEIEARQVPLWAGFGKLLFSLLVVVPGLAAAHMLPELGTSRRFDQALPELMTVFYGPAMLGLGFTALTASLMSGLAANTSAFSAIWTEDIYRAHLRSHESDRHYLAMGRLAACVAVIFGALASYIDFLFGNLMEHVQLIFSVFGAPLWAVFLLGMTTRRCSERGAIVAYLGGSAVALLHLIAFSLKWIGYGSMMSANFHAAIYAFCTAIVLGWVIKPSSTSQPIRSQKDLAFQWKGSWRDSKPALWTLALLLLAFCVALNLFWR
jgi:SSS family solute:Na+ symporter